MCFIALGVMGDSAMKATKLEIVKESESLYQAVVFSDEGELIWGSECGMLADELGRFLHDTYGFHQLDIFEKLAASDPNRFFVNMDRELELARKVLADHQHGGEYNEYLLNQLRSWVKKTKESVQPLSNGQGQTPIKKL